jgi:pimeloyl-ACP methyl ester carboxylesterase
MRNRPEAMVPQVHGQTIRLADGRRLGFAQWGDPHGTPVLEFRGFPSSSVGDAIDPAFLLANRIRRITVDRPGVGLSDYQPGRRLLDWPDDVLELADALGLDRFSVLGTSGGGPYALACACRIPGRLVRVALVSGLGPLDRPGALDGLNPAERRIMLLSQRSPVVARAVVGLAVAAERLRPGTLLGGLARAMPPCDQAVLARPAVRASLLDSYARAFAGGTRGQVHDWGVIAAPWGFVPGEITVEVQLWQGDQDDRVPLHHAKHLAGAISGSRLRILRGEGHMIAFTHIEQALRELTASEVTHQASSA